MYKENAKKIAKQLLEIVPRTHLLSFMVDGYLFVEKKESYLDYANREVGPKQCCLQCQSKAHAYVYSDEFLTGPLTLDKLNKIYNICAEFRHKSDNYLHLIKNQCLPRNVRGVVDSYSTCYTLGKNHCFSDNGLKELALLIKEKGEEWGIGLIPLPNFANARNHEDATVLIQHALKSNDAITAKNVDNYTVRELKKLIEQKKYSYVAPKPSIAKELLTKELNILNTALTASNSKRNDKENAIRNFTHLGCIIHPWIDYNLRTFSCFEHGVRAREGLFPSVSYMPHRVFFYTDEERSIENGKNLETTRKLIRNASNGPDYVTSRYERVMKGRIIWRIKQNESERYYKLFMAYDTKNPKDILSKIVVPFRNALERIAFGEKRIIERRKVKTHSFSGWKGGFLTKALPKLNISTGIDGNLHIEAKSSNKKYFAKLTEKYEITKEYPYDIVFYDDEYFIPSKNSKNALKEFQKDRLIEKDEFNNLILEVEELQKILDEGNQILDQEKQKKEQQTFSSLLK